MNKILNDDGTLYIEDYNSEEHRHIHACYFLFKRGEDWETLLKTPLEDLEKRMNDIIERENRKVAKIDEIRNSPAFLEFAKANAKYLEFMKKLNEARNNPAKGDDEVKALKKEASKLLDELAKDFKKQAA